MTLLKIQQNHFLIDFSKLKICWNKSDISQDGDMCTLELSVYNQDNAQLVFGNITLTDTSSVTNLGSDIVNNLYFAF